MLDRNKYNLFFNILEKKVTEKEFEKKLLEVVKIDKKYYMKKIEIQNLIQYIKEYKNKEIKEEKFKDIQILLPGNPEIVFQICLEAVRYHVNMRICIEDFCLAQNTFIVEFINQIIEECKLKNKLEIKNILKDIEIIEYSKKVNRTICIGDSNLYHRLCRKINNFMFYPYGILEIYSDSDEFDILTKTIYEFAMQNQFELDFYDELSFYDAIKAINRDGYQFCTLLLSKDKEKIEKFQSCIKSKYVVLNENPFKIIKFDLEII